MSVKYTVEELLLDESFISYCKDINSIHRMKWERIIQQNPGQLEAIKEAKQLLTLLDPQLSADEIDTEVNQLRQVMAARNTSTGISSDEEEAILAPLEKRAKRRTISKGVWMAAAGLVICAAGFYFMQQRDNQQRPEMAVLLYQTGTTERKEMTLPDGSHVILKSNSKLSLVGDYNKTERKLRLEGEAFFEVVKDKQRPFIVESNDFSTTAVGTAFYIDGRDPRNEYTVTLLEGKVKVNGEKGAEDFLDAGQKAVWSGTQDAAFIKNHFDTLQLRNWVDGKLVLDKASAAATFHLLRNWYGVKIEDRRRVKPATLLSGTYEKKSVEDVLKVLCFSLMCKYHIENDTIIIQ